MNESIIEACRKKMEFLENEYGFEFESPDSISVIYKRPKTRIAIKDNGLGEISVRISLAAENADISVKPHFRTFDLEEILEIRTGTVQPAIDGFPSISLVQLSMEKHVEYIASAMRLHLSDVLKGDSSVADEIDKRKYG